MKRLIEKVAAWWDRRRGMMTMEELEKRIAADMTDEDIDRFLPPSLRKHVPVLRDERSEP